MSGWREPTRLSAVVFFDEIHLARIPFVTVTLNLVFVLETFGSRFFGRIHRVKAPFETVFLDLVFNGSLNMFSIEADV